MFFFFLLSKIIPQVRMLIMEFCQAKNLPQPAADLNELSLGCSSTSSTNLSQNNDSGHVSTNSSDNENDANDENSNTNNNIDDSDDQLDDEEEEEEEEDHVDDDDAEMEDPSPSTSKNAEKSAADVASKEIEGISKDNWRLLEKVKSTQMHDHLKGKYLCYKDKDEFLESNEISFFFFFNLKNFT